jgi:hypothetical protein
MLASPRTRPALASAALALALAAPAAAETPPPPRVPVQVTVRVLGAPPAFPTLLGSTPVTTTTETFVKDGGSCSAASAAGALELATGGSWEGHWNAGFGDYEVVSIEGQEYPFQPGSAENFFWSVWLNGSETATGVCGTALANGDQLLFFPGCFGSECPPPPDVLEVAAPPVAEVGAPVPVSVVSHPGAGGEPSPAAGAALSSEGAAAVSDAGGHATLTFAHPGSIAIHANGARGGPLSVPGEALICVHAGNDGTCGAPGPAPSAAGAPGGHYPPYSGPYALVAKITGLLDGHVYRHGHGPRLLSGQVLAHAPVAAVSLRLRRRRGARCFSFSGSREAFLRSRCGVGSFFKVSTSSSFSYLLPRPLPRGRYVLDIEATDSAGNHTELARGTSRIVFYVA